MSEASVLFNKSSLFSRVACTFYTAAKGFKSQETEDAKPIKGYSWNWYSIASEYSLGPMSPRVCSDPGKKEMALSLDDECQGHNAEGPMVWEMAWPSLECTTCHATYLDGVME